MLATATQRTLDAVAAQASSAIESARLYREAAVNTSSSASWSSPPRFSARCLPQPRESGTHFEVAAACIPCRTIGGDFFDYFDFRTATSGSRWATLPARGRRRRCSPP